ncbi:SUMF1/EgtB/PvdO family nonheme iron enzyme [Pirellulales bacterium]|nr:SUMF1/EgtB/PvdO family nonheme iron enzyme [Pirellulales bacterium]
MDEQFSVPEVFELRDEVPSLDPECPKSVRIYTHLLTGMDFVLVPGGVGVVGSNEDRVDEGPKHTVRLKPFLLGRYPVTLEQWRDAMGNEPIEAPFSPDRRAVTRLGDAYPVADVSWDECMEFCRRTGLELPSEAEWEYACRAGRDDDEMQDLDDQAWHYHNTSNRDVQPVGLKRANAFGLHDMLGNVWEWCADSWHDTYAGASADGTAWFDGTSVNRVQRGGSVEHSPDSCRASTRLPGAPDMRQACEGFRVKCQLRLTEHEDVERESGGVAIPDGFNSLGRRRSEFNGVAYELEWICHTPTGVELPLLPGGVYDAENLRYLSEQVEILFSGDVIVTLSGASHPELLNWLLSRNMEVYPALVGRFLTGDTRTRHSAAFWHAELSIKQLDGTDLPYAMPSAEVFHAALEEMDSEIRGMAAATFGGFSEHSQRYLPELIGLLKDSECCRITLETIGHIGGRTAGVAVPAILRTAAAHDDAGVREKAVETVEKMSWGGLFAVSDEIKQQAVPILLSLMECDEDNARKTAARCLGLLGTGPDVHAALTDCLGDRAADVREVAQRALDRLSSPEEGLD